jgi:hypothetical protein
MLPDVRMHLKGIAVRTHRAPRKDGDEARSWREHIAARIAFQLRNLARPVAAAAMAIAGGIWGAFIVADLPAIPAAYAMLGCSLVGVLGGMLLPSGSRGVRRVLEVSTVTGYLVGLFWFDWMVYLGPTVLFIVSLVLASWPSATWAAASLAAGSKTTDSADSRREPPP